jgi:hypothetical protein
MKLYIAGHIVRTGTCATWAGPSGRVRRSRKINSKNGSRNLSISRQSCWDKDGSTETLAGNWKRPSYALSSRNPVYSHVYGSESCKERKKRSESCSCGKHISVSNNGPGPDRAKSDFLTMNDVNVHQH